MRVRAVDPFTGALRVHPGEITMLSRSWQPLAVLLVLSLVMVFSAFSGAAAVVNGVLILLGQIKLDTINDGIFGSLFAQGIVGTVAWLVLGAAALYWQIRDVGSSIQSIDRSSYRY
jgi:hypothetical protein